MSLEDADAEAMVVRWCEKHCGTAVEIVSRERTAPAQLSFTFKPRGAGQEAVETRIFDFGKNRPQDNSSPQYCQWTITASRPAPATEQHPSNGTQAEGLQEHGRQPNAHSADGHRHRDANEEEDDEDYGAEDSDDADANITSTEAAEELAELQQDQEMSVEELRKLYGSPEEAAAKEREILDHMTTEQAMQLAAQWYNTYGPYRGTYTMRPRRAFRNTPSQWSIKFRVTPDTSFLYFRRFHFAVDDGQPLVVRWSEDPEMPPGAEYDPLDDAQGGSEDDDAEDEEMLAEVEAALGEDNDDDELADLQADNELSVEELMAKYYGGAGAGGGEEDEKDDATARSRSAGAAAAGGGGEDYTKEERGSSPGRGRRRRRQAAQPQPHAPQDTTAAGTMAEATSDTQVQQQHGGTAEAAAGAQSVPEQKVEVAETKRPSRAREDEANSGDEEQAAKRAKTGLQAEDGTAAPETTTTPQVLEEPRTGAGRRGSDGNTGKGADDDDDDDTDDDDDDDADWCSDVDGSDPLLQYMRRAAEEADAHEEYVSNYKPPKIGPQYQAIIPSASGNANAIRGETANQVWAPIPDNKGVTVEELKRYEDLYRGHDRQHEHALTALYHHDYDVAAARKAMEAYIEPDPWSQEEIERLHHLIVTERRQFHRISALMPNRSTRSIIRCYYDTKKLRGRCLSDHREYVLSSDDENEDYEQPVNASPEAHPHSINIAQESLGLQPENQPAPPPMLPESMLLPMATHTHDPAHNLRPSPGPPQMLPLDAPHPFGELSPPHRQHMATTPEEASHDTLFNPANAGPPLPSSSPPPPQ